MGSYRIVSTGGQWKAGQPVFPVGKYDHDSDAVMHADTVFYCRTLTAATNRVAMKLRIMVGYIEK